MNTSRIVRRAELAAEIQRRRSLLHMMTSLQNRQIKERLAALIEVSAKELEQLEREYHALNVEQIREELANG